MRSVSSAQAAGVAQGAGDVPCQPGMILDHQDAHLFSVGERTVQRKRPLPMAAVQTI